VPGIMVRMSATDEITALYLAEHERLERQISRRVGCRSTACDLVHDIFLRLWVAATERKGNPAAYLSRCARNAAIDHVRAERTRRAFFTGVLPEQYASEPATPHDILAARQDISRVDEALAALPRKTRHIFLLNRVHGRSFTEIAAVLEISPRAVAKHMARAVAACQAIA
jgi:RNA polymerase sigma factor (sigma-70 family)